MQGDHGEDTMRGRGRDVMAGGLDNDILCGGPQGDTAWLKGRRHDVRRGGEGSDLSRTGRRFLVGGKDADQLGGRVGDGTLDSVDGLPNDLARGQGGTDACTTDPWDTIDGCEA